MTTTDKRRLGTWVLIGMVAVAVLLRGPITGVPPALRAVSETLALSPTMAGLASTLPLLCFGAFAFLTPILSARFGLEPTLWVAAALVVAGILLRVVVTTPTFFGGTLLIGMGIALGNVVWPALARTWFPDNLSKVMGTFSFLLQISGSAGPLVVSPLIAGGWPWHRALAVWLIPAIIVFVLWSLVSVLVARDAHGRPHLGAAPKGMGQTIRHPRNWAITFYMGVQSLLFYTLVTWLPTRLRLAGFGEGTAGVLLSAFVGLGLVGSWWGGYFAYGRWGRHRLVGLYAVQLIGLFLLGTGPVGVLVGLVVCGICQGLSLPIALTFIAHQPNPSDVPALSALAQGVGYLIASLGPVIVGALYASSGSMVPGGILLIVLVFPLAVVGLLIARYQVRRDAAGAAEARG